MLKLLSLQMNDWAGGGYFLTEALNKYSNGKIKAKHAVCNKHQYDYPHGLLIGHNTTKEAEELLEWCDVIQFRGSEYIENLGYIKVPTDKVIGQWHIGTAYRNNPAIFNVIDRDMQCKFYGLDLLQYAPIGGVGLPAHIDVDKYKQPPTNYEEGDRLIVSHTPSNNITKGTEVIEYILKDFIDNEQVEYRKVVGKSWAESMEAKKGTHVYIGQINPMIGGFGLAEIEAAVMGCAVLSTCNNIPDEYNCPFNISHDPLSLISQIQSFINRPDYLLAKQIDCFKFVEDWCSYKAGAKIIIDAYEEHDIL